jgi:hypothetical protein
VDGAPLAQVAEDLVRRALLPVLGVGDVDRVEVPLAVVALALGRNAARRLAGDWLVGQSKSDDWTVVRSCRQ